MVIKVTILEKGRTSRRKEGYERTKKQIKLWELELFFFIVVCLFVPRLDASFFYFFGLKLKGDDACIYDGVCVVDIVIYINKKGLNFFCTHRNTHFWRDW